MAATSSTSPASSAARSTTVEARLRESYGARCWFVDVGFASGAIGHLDLTVAVRMDWHEGFQIQGEHGGVLAKTYNPWYYKSSDVDIFHESDGDVPPRRSAPTAISTAARSRALPTRC